jgi:uroporphyrinogen decarboxylase
MITGKELVFAALRRETVSRAPWVPFVGVHGAFLLGVSSTDFLKSADLIVQGQTRAAELYRPDGLPIVFDLQLEAEALGCELAWADDVPPSVISHPLQTSADAVHLPPLDFNAGRYPVVREASRRLAATLGANTALYGLITGPFTLLSHLRGSELFLDMLTDPEGVKSAMDWCADAAIAAAGFYLRNGADVIAVVDPMTSQISSAHFDEFVGPYVNKVFDAVRGKGGFSSLFVCGDATRNLEVMCRTRCDNVSVDENIPLVQLREHAAHFHKSYGGNIRLTTVLLMGSEDDAKLDAIRCFDEGLGPGFILAPGCDLPYATPEANLRAVASMALDPYQRDVARVSARASAVDSFEDIVLPDYAAEEAVVIDCITLDSSACAPCQYMVDAAVRAAERASVPVHVHEHKIKNRNGVGMMCRLGVKNIPTICIDGVAKFVSIMPDIDTLVAAIEARHREKK